MEDLIIRFGLAAVYIGAVIEGDVTLFLCGVTAHLGLINLPLGVAVAAAGCFTGDLFWYAAGRLHSGTIKGMRAYRVVGPSVERAAARIGPWQIVVSRVVYGTRIATMVFWGVQRLPLAKFAFVGAVGCVGWAVLLGALGYAASTGAALILGEVKRVELWMLGAIAGSLLLFFAMRLASASVRQGPGGLPERS
jgi:membrane protein DedA with SNARE-associated domain